MGTRKPDDLVAALAGDGPPTAKEVEEFEAKIRARRDSEPLVLSDGFTWEKQCAQDDRERRAWEAAGKERRQAIDLRLARLDAAVREHLGKRKRGRGGERPYRPVEEREAVRAETKRLVSAGAERIQIFERLWARWRVPPSTAGHYIRVAEKALRKAEVEVKRQMRRVRTSAEDSFEAWVAREERALSMSMVASPPIVPPGVRVRNKIRNQTKRLLSLELKHDRIVKELCAEFQIPANTARSWLLAGLDDIAKQRVKKEHRREYLEGIMLQSGLSRPR